MTRDFDELVDAISRLERLPREEILAMSGREFVRYIKLLRIQNSINSQCSHVSHAENKSIGQN